MFNSITTRGGGMLTSTTTKEGYVYLYPDITLKDVFKMKSREI